MHSFPYAKYYNSNILDYILLSTLFISLEESGKWELPFFGMGALWGFQNFDCGLEGGFGLGTRYLNLPYMGLSGL